MELLFPANIYCINCNEPISRKNKYSLCKKCYKEIEFLIEKNTNYDKEVIKLMQRKYIESVDIVCVYKNCIKDMIIKLKYENKTFISKYFADIIYDYIKKKNIQFDYIISTPIHKNRLKQRGYNQVDLIAKYLSKLTKKEQIYVSERIKDTKNMYELSLKDRNKEMKDAFKSKHIEKLQSKTVLVIDDILTTGSTATNLCKSIKEQNKNTNLKLIFFSRASVK